MFRERIQFANIIYNNTASQLIQQLPYKFFCFDLFHSYFYVYNTKLIIFIILPMGSNNSKSETTSSTHCHSNLSQFSRLKEIQHNFQEPTQKTNNEKRNKSRGIQNTCFLNSPKPRKYSLKQEQTSLWDQEKYMSWTQVKSNNKKYRSKKSGFQRTNSPKLKSSIQNKSFDAQSSPLKNQNEELLLKFEVQQKTKLYQELLLKIQQGSLHQDLQRIDCYFEENYQIKLQEFENISEDLSIQKWKESVNRIILILQFLFQYQQGVLITCCKLRLILTQKQTFYFMKLLLQNTSQIINAGEQYSLMMDFLNKKIQEQYPKFNQILDRNDLDLQYFCTNWVLSLFSIGFPLQFSIKFWKKALLCQKVEIKKLFQLQIMQVVKIAEKVILQNNWQNDINYYLKTDTTLLMKFIQVKQN